MSLARAPSPESVEAPQPGQLAISDYAIIGDGRSAALVGKNGSIDWLCWPRFDSSSLFATILDPAIGGCWRVGPRGPAHVSRSYVEGTNVLQTRFVTASGVLVLTDLMAVASEEDKRRILMAEHELLRELHCEEGEVEVDLLFDPRPDYGRKAPRLEPWGSLGLKLALGPTLVSLRSEVPLQIRRSGPATGSLHMRAGETRHLSLSWSGDAPAVLPPLGERAREAIERSINWWRGWISQCTYDGPNREEVLRSALTLKLMIYAPSGAVVAAPTTSLPEIPGGPANWDYRYCWLRDASFTARALFGLGFHPEAQAFVSWLLQATRLTRPKLNILYDVFGGSGRKEVELSHLQGFHGARPVRVGNAAKKQLQLDVYGEVIDAATQFVYRGPELDRETQRMLVQLGRYVCRNWRQPDQGIWEPRQPSRHHTHSRVLCWTALDRLIELHRNGQLRGLPVKQLERHRDEIRHEVEQRAWNNEIGTYTAVLDGAEVDASTLLMAWYGFHPPDHPRMRRTYLAVRKRLGHLNSPLLHRYEHSRPVGEGAFGICSFWGVEYLARGGGELDEAEQLFHQLCRLSNDVNLFAEEIHPETLEHLGNFPQAFTHVGLINAALSLTDRSRQERQRKKTAAAARKEP